MPKKPTKQTAKPREVVDGLFAVADAINNLAEKFSWLDPIGQLLSIHIVKELKKHNADDSDDNYQPF